MSPVYMYECDCADWERTCKVEDRDETVGRLCKHCESKIRRVITPTTFILKGSCWERDNYATTLGDAVKGGKTFKSE